MMQPIRIYPHTRLAEMAVQAGIIDEGHDLIEGQLWNPGHLRHAVSGIQAGASALYQLRERWGRLMGEAR
jgi:hypothetical protein